MNRPPTEARAWRLALNRLTEIETGWKDSAARQTGLLECGRWLADQTTIPRLCGLAPLVKPGISLAQFTSVLVPVEREVARCRITDVRILDRDASGPTGSHAERMPVTVVADSLRSAFNTGGLFRTAECFGAEALWLCGYTASPDHPHVAEAALGAENLVSWRVFPRAGDAIDELRGLGIAVVALETVDGAADLASFIWPFPCALLLGNERFGLDPASIRGSDTCVRIAVHGRKNSLNVVSAAAIALHTARCAWDGYRAQTDTKARAS